MKDRYTTDPMREFEPWLDEDGTVAADGIERREVVFDVQRGELMERGSKNNNHRWVRK